MNNTFTKILWSISVLAGIVYTTFFFLFSIPRLFYPYELEWMEGAIADHAIRIFEGKQLYVRPSIEFANWLYQPLYYYASAAAMQIFGVGFFAGRFVSYCSTLLSASLIYLVVRKISGERLLLPFISVALFLASYGTAGYSHDIGRIDAMLVFLLLASTACLVFTRSYLSVIFSAVLLSLAFFTKQPAVFYLLPPILWLFLIDKKRFAVFSFCLITCIAIGVLILTHQNGQWYEYHVFTVPRGKAAHGGFGWLATFKAFPGYIFSFWTASTSVILMYIFMQTKNGVKHFLQSIEGLLTLVFLASIVQLAMQTGDHASYRNIALPFACFSAIVFPIALKKMREDLSGSVSQAVLLALPIQFIALFYNPLHDPLVAITAKDRAIGEAFYSMIHDLPGDVYLPMHGLLPQLAGKREFVNELAIGDVFTLDDSIARAVKKEYDLAFKTHRFSYVLTDDNLFRTMFHANDSVEGYTFSHRINISATPFISRIGDFPTTPCKLFIPKTTE